MSVMGNNMTQSQYFIPNNRLKEYLLNIFNQLQIERNVAKHVTQALLHASLRGIDSHGVRLLSHYIQAVKKGRINTNPKYKFHKTSASTGVLDADHTFGHAACGEALKYALNLAKDSGSGHIAIQNSSHFGAASYYAYEIAKNDMLGISMTNTDAQLRTPRGIRPFLGNNPICFAAPAENNFIFTLDMATSMMTYNKIQQLNTLGKMLPSGIAANKDGHETINPKDVAMLLPFGEHRGFGLSLVIEIFCSMFTGMLYGPDIPKMFDAPLNQKRYIGQFISAYRIDCFQPIDTFKKRFSSLLNRLRQEPALNQLRPILVPGDLEVACKNERTQKGIPTT